MSKQRSIFVPDSHTPSTPARRRGIVEATILKALAGGAAMVRAANGRTYIVDEHGQAISEVKQ